MITTFNPSESKEIPFENIVGNGENACYQYFLFSQNVFHSFKKKFHH